MLNIVEDIRGHGTLLVSFASGVNLHVSGNVTDFKNSINDLECDIIYLSDSEFRWYLSVVDETTKYLNNKVGQYDKVIFIGSSMGGFASLLFSALVRCDVSLNFSPQTSLKRLLDNEDDRFPKFTIGLEKYNTKFFEIKDWIRESDNCVRHIFYGESNKNDKWYVDEVKDIESVQVHPQETDEHNVAAFIKDKYGLKEIIKVYL